jgi:hypothetical protein
MALVKENFFFEVGHIGFKKIDSFILNFVTLNCMYLSDKILPKKRKIEWVFKKKFECITMFQVLRCKEACLMRCSICKKNQDFINKR